MDYRIIVGVVKMTERQRKAMARLLTATDRCLPMERALAKQLEAKNLVRITEHVYERRQWNRVVARLPIVQALCSAAEIIC